MSTISVFANPLKVLEWEPNFQALNLPKNPTPKRLRQFLCSLYVSSDTSALKERYIEASEKDQALFLSIEEPELIENVFGPLRQAKTNYVLGNYVGSIALCGIVAEKVALLLYLMSSPSKTKFKKFEHDGQELRVKKLKLARLIDEQSANDFQVIRNTRNYYLHNWNTPAEHIAQKAVQAYDSALRLVVCVTDIGFSNGSANLNPELRKYLEDRGALVVNEDNE